ncbi:diphosphomevalonate decarboxylase [Candidatus Bathyarchaeota archaeon]|nr:diphosphomevalonate decarboxylase [Candidatus Bathyarchaeota archaeon]
MKAQAIAHPIQGLIKYHGLKDETRRIPYHDSISVCVKGLRTITTVEFDSSLSDDLIILNKNLVTGREKERVKIILNSLRKIAKESVYARVVSENSLKLGKGLGFSASGFAALGLAACKALDLNLDFVSLSEIVRLGAGSATRSLVGGFALWYANKNGRSYAEQLAGPRDIDLKMIIVPISSELKTDEAHKEVTTSPLFQARLRYIGSILREMKKAIKCKDISIIGRLAEEDTLNLHAITMTSQSHLVLWEPETVRVIKEVMRLREEGIPCWYSIDTGPSVFINTYPEHAFYILRRIGELNFPLAIVSDVGGKAHTI